jgi:hypothetical protein
MSWRQADVPQRQSNVRDQDSGSGLSTHSISRIHVRPARSIFSKKAALPQVGRAKLFSSALRESCPTFLDVYLEL